VGGKDNRTRTAKSRPYRGLSADASLCLIALLQNNR
jgi:hypothetical protein